MNVCVHVCTLSLGTLREARSLGVKPLQQMLYFFTLSLLAAPY